MGLNFDGAKKIDNFSGMPQMEAAFAGWAQNIVLGLVSQGISSDGDSVSTVQDITFFGIIQPLSIKQLANKPEGSRSWKWLQIHAFNGSLNLRTNDLITYKGKTYKVMGINDYSLNNYIEYHVVADYEVAP